MSYQFFACIAIDLESNSSLKLLSYPCAIVKGTNVQGLLWNQHIPYNRIISCAYPSISKVILKVDNSFDFKSIIFCCRHARSIRLLGRRRIGDQFTILRNVWGRLLTFYKSRYLKMTQVSNLTGCWKGKIFNLLPKRWKAIPKGCVISSLLFKTNWLLKAHLNPWIL